ncbi:hypothetical protein [Salinicoccus roseus]|uniref:Uncharacterized protein n=1 Tax=Salinicoccus roseus TaxID=45670 RepID=A0A265E6C7_9STAP|nr:hypothetical protein [Salinicoccus roseus]OZT77123.1 hypothetical protein CFN03_08590 [Salinicoccus roseus]
MEIIVVFISGLLIGVLIMQAVYRKDLGEMNDSFEEVRRRHNMMVNKMFDDIDSEVEARLREERGESTHAVNPLPYLEKVQALADGVVIEEAKTYPPLKQIGDNRVEGC